MSIPCRKAFTGTLLELARRYPRIVALATDSRGSVTLGDFAKELPEQFVEVGIAEQDAVGIAAGMALGGKNAFVCGPASFLSARSLEQVKVDVAYAHTNVKVIGVSGGVSYGALGATHHSLHDIAVMRAFEGLTVVLPCDARQTVQLTRVLAQTEGPVYVRMGRAAVPDVYEQDDPPFVIGQANELLPGGDVTIIATGEAVSHALGAGRLLRQKGVQARVLDMHTLKPLDREAVIRAARETGHIVTVEEHSVCGGLGAAVAQTVVEECPVPMRIVGIPDAPLVAGTSAEVFRTVGISADHIAETAIALLGERAG